MRTKYSLYNSFFSVFSSIFAMAVTFISQAIFIRLLGTEYLGLNGLFSNILTILSVFELGIGNAIIFNLYKPVEDNDNLKIKQLLNFYKSAYCKVGIFVFILGLVLIPFLPFFIGTVSVNINIGFIYIIFLITTSSSYFLSYKRSVLFAYQKNYYVDICHILYNFFLNFFQIIALLLTHNYYIYLIIKLLCVIFENIIITLIANKQYPHLKDNKNEKLDKETQKDILKKIKALFFHKLSGAVVNGTDNILISSFFGISMVGIYSNYYLIFSGVNSIFGKMFSSLTSSVGNLLLSSTDEKKFEVFEHLRFLNFLIASFTSVCIYCVINPFINLWVGKEYILGASVTLVLIFNYYQKTMRASFAVFKDAAGIWHEDRFVPIIEACLNIVISILAAHYFGIIGVFLGTIISGLCLWLYSYPKYVYKKIFKRKYSNYYLETFGYIFVFILLLFSISFISSYIIIDNLILQIFIRLILCFCLYSVLIIVIYGKTNKFIYLKNLVCNLINKKSLTI